MRTAHRILLLLLYGASLGVLAYFAWQGLPYYLTPLVERPRHEGYWILKPGGTVGLKFGIVGSLLMIVMHVYTLRRRARWMQGFGRLRAWLDFHIYCGVMGPLLIVLHSSFKVQGLVALSFWSMVAVALSGVLGRYLYLQLPRRRSGVGLTLAELEKMSAEIADRMRQRFDLAEASLERLDDLASSLRSDISLPTLLVRLPLEGLRLRWRLRSFRASFKGLARREVRELASLAARRAALQQRIRLLARLQELFHYWHVIHRPFAIVMYLFMFVHIGVVLMTGYGWTWSGK